MLIEDVDSFKAWLHKSLTPVCDADPAALTNYIYALIKKDKPESELRENCLDQLDVFLQNKTVSFVDSLFIVLKDKSYVGLIPPKSGSPVVSTTTPTTQQPATQSSPGLQTTPDTTNDTKDTSKPDISKDKKRPDDTADRANSDRSRDSRRKRSRSRSRSLSPRRGDDRRRRYDRSRYSPPSRRYGGRRRSRSKSPGRRWSPDRRRSRSPRNRSRDRSRTPRSRSRSRSKGRKSDSRGSTPTQDNYSNIVSTSNVTGSRIPSSIGVVTSSEDARKQAAAKLATTTKARCRDYDEKGFCMRGDLCPFDHGIDPVIVEESGIPCVLPFPPTTSGSSGLPVIPPPGLPPIPAGPPPDFSKPPPPIPQRPPPPTEVYNPEAPGLTGPRPPFWPGGPRASGPRHPFGLSRPPGPYFNQPPPQINPLALPRVRDLVRVQTMPPAEESGDVNGKGKSMVVSEARVVVPSKRTYDMIEKGGGAGEPQHVSSPKKHFDIHTRLGGYRKPNPNMENSSLEVRKIPRELNNIAKLNEHFGKFGTVVNLQICFEGDPEAALIIYADNQSAFSAYRSSEPVFNNRFIKVFWHKKQEPGAGGEGQEGTTQQAMAEAKSIKSRLGPTIIPHHSKLSLNNKNKPDNKEIVYTSSIGSLKKTVINPTAIAKTTSVLTSPTAVGSASFVKKIEEIKRKEGLKQEAIKKKVEIEKQKQMLLEKQISQQKVLIGKLDSSKTMSTEEKAVIMKALKTMTESIEKLKLELLPQNYKSPNLKSVDETRKEILDTELELINKQNAGEDTTVLRLKLTQLTKEAQSLGVFGRGRGRGVRGRGVRGGRGMRGRGAFLAFGRGGLSGVGGGSMTIDNRPKILEVKNFEVAEKEEVKSHFAAIAQIDKCEFVDSVPSAIITFKTRKGAESALARGIKFKGKTLEVGWYVVITRTISREGRESDEEAALPEEIDEDSLLAGDDEEDEDEESRSWRR